MQKYFTQGGKNFQKFSPPKVLFHAIPKLTMSYEGMDITIFNISTFYTC